MDVHHVPWENVCTSDGGIGAAAVAEALLALGRCAPSEVDELFDRLHHLVIHDHSGGVSEAAVHSVPFLVQIAVSQPSARPAIADLLEHVATGWPSSNANGGFDEHLSLVRRQFGGSASLMRQVPELSWLANLVVQGIVPGGQVGREGASVGGPWQVRAGRPQLENVHNVGGLVASTEFNGSFSLLDPLTGTTICAGDGLPCAYVMRAGQTMVAASAAAWERKGTLWDVTFGTPRKLARIRKRGNLFTSYGEVLLVGGGRRLWRVDPLHGKVIDLLLAHDRPLCAIGVHADMIVGVDDECRIHRWAADTGRPLGALNSWASQNARFASCALPDGRQVIAVTSLDSRSVVCHDLASGEVLWRKDFPGGPLCSILTDGEPRFALGAFRQILILDAATGEQAGDMLSGHREDISGLTMAAAGDQPALFSCDGTEMWRWNLATGAPLPQ